MAGAESQHVAVIGAGPWGLAAAWAAGAQGARVTILDDGRPPTGAVAAGMIAPWSETEDDDQPLHATLRRAAEAWPSFASRLAAAGGDPGYEPIGSLAVAARPEHLGVVRRLRDALERVGRSEPW